MEQAGYSLVSSNPDSGVKNNQFYSYRNRTKGVHISYFPNYEGGTVRVVYDFAGYQPSLTQEVQTNAVVEPTVAQLSRTGAANAELNNAAGMGYVIQLSDGRYIIVDGGNWNATDGASLLTYLKNNNPDKNAKPVIAGWFITHAHGDHVDLARYFLRNYSNQVELQAMFYNFPQLEGTGAITLTQTDNPVVELNGMASVENDLENVLSTYFPTAARYKYQTGESFWLGDAKIDILFTHQDYVHQGTGSSSTAFVYGNDTSNAFRITINGYEMMFTGDLDVRACPEMVEMYGNELDCQIMQVPHHGLNGGDIDMYDAMKPNLLFWPIDSSRYSSVDTTVNECHDHTNSKHLFNWYVKEGYSFHASQTTVVNLSTGEITVNGTKQSQKLTK